ncbi:ferredoxin [Pseudonocardia sp. KRD291]|uniref:ferredoxin n=1 Tax=Pseudonocardia sp. KRD291 TaxID=2792007 RepID=UPI0027E2C39F|nr:ferredoxin [Pseudonocardia sp. KRD291]
MKVHIEVGVDGGQQGCTGHGRCAMMAGEFYEVDDDGYAIHRGETVDVPAGLEDAARYGAGVCPERVIQIEE